MTPRRAAARARLLDAAVEMFAAKGFHGTSTRDIAKAAGMSPAAMYVHAESKEQLLYLSARAGQDEALHVIRTAKAQGGTALERARRLMHDLALHHVRSQKVSRVVNYELSALSPEHLDEIQALRRQVIREFRELVEEGMATGEFSPGNHRMAVNALISLAVDIARWYHVDLGDAYAPEVIAESYGEMAVRILIPASGSQATPGRENPAGTIANPA
jgi:AcrR family transcriptional regulator